MGRLRLLLIEDDGSLRDALASALTTSGYEVRADSSGEALGDALTRYRPDLVILDIRLPGGPDGFDLAADIRSSSDVPMLFITALDAIEDRLRGFAVGADDYIVKPFPVAELVARVRAVLRRNERAQSPTFEVCDLLIDEDRGIAMRGDIELDLTPTEFKLLVVLARHPNNVFSKTRLLTHVWGWDQYAPNLVEVHVSSLRRKLEAAGPRLIETERGAGYVLRA